MPRRKGQNFALVVAILTAGILFASVGRIDAQSDSSTPEKGVVINKRPFTEVGVYIEELIQKKELDLNAEFAVSCTGRLTKDGRLEPGSVRWTVSEGSDAKMTDVAKRILQAVNESGYLFYLNDLGATNVRFDVRQNHEQFSVLLQSDVVADTRARMIASMLSALVQATIAFKEEKLKAQDMAAVGNYGIDELAMLKKIVVKTEGSTFVLAFDLPKATAQQLLLTKLGKAGN